LILPFGNADKIYNYRGTLPPAEGLMVSNGEARGNIFNNTYQILLTIKMYLTHNSYTIMTFK